jgi:hypothetical protein
MSSILEYTNTVNRAVVRGVFRKFNSTSDVIDTTQLADVIVELGIPRKVLDKNTIDALSQAMDDDRSGTVEFNEFFKWWSKMATTDGKNLAVRVKNIGKLFDIVRKFDLDNSGDLNHSEFKQLWEHMGNDANIVEDIIKKIDKDSDQKISFLELAVIFGFVDGNGELSTNYFSKLWAKSISFDQHADIVLLPEKVPKINNNDNNRYRAFTRAKNALDEYNDDELTCDLNTSDGSDTRELQEQKIKELSKEIQKAKEESAKLVQELRGIKDTSYFERSKNETLTKEVQELQQEVEELQDKVQTTEQQRVFDELQADKQTSELAREKDVRLRLQEELKREKEEKLQEKSRSDVLQRSLQQFSVVVKTSGNGSGNSTPRGGIEENSIKDMRQALERANAETAEVREKYSATRLELERLTNELSYLKERQDIKMVSPTSPILINYTNSNLDQDSQYQRLQEEKNAIERKYKNLVMSTYDLDQLSKTENKKYKKEKEAVQVELKAKEVQLKQSKNMNKALQKEILIIRKTCNCHEVKKENRELKDRIEYLLEEMSAIKSLLHRSKLEKNVSPVSSPKKSSPHRVYRYVLPKATQALSGCIWKKEHMPHTFNISEDGLTVSCQDMVSDFMVVGSRYAPLHEVSFWEIEIKAQDQVCYIGVVADHLRETFATSQQFNSYHAWALRSDGFLFEKGRPKPTKYCENFTNRKVRVGVLLDLVHSNVTFFLNGRPNGIAFTEVFGEIRPAVTLSGNSILTADFSVTVNLD